MACHGRQVATQRLEAAQEAARLQVQWAVAAMTFLRRTLTDRLMDEQASRQTMNRKQRHTQTDRQTDRQTDGQADRHSARQADRQTDRQLTCIYLRLRLHQLVA